MRSIKTIKDVVDWGLCTGCGACGYFCGKESVTFHNIDDVGIRPLFTKNNPEKLSEALAFCPGYTVPDRNSSPCPPAETELLIGPTMEIWEGYSSDRVIREKSSSGGILSALASYCLEKEGMELVVHSAMKQVEPWLNETVISRTREEVVSRSGSRYCPSSPCDRLEAIQKSSKACVFIGKPCDVAAVNALRRIKPELDAKLGLVLTFFCAGTPSSQATRSLMGKHGVNSDEVQDIRYRGDGWPGRFRVTHTNGNTPLDLSYKESWSYLAKKRPFRCMLCPDGLGQLADISCGDAWHRFREDGDPGRSLVLVRSELGHSILAGAVKYSYLELEPSSESNVVLAQELVRRRPFVFGRQLAMRLMLVPTPRYDGFHLFKAWLGISLMDKVRSILGTWRRMLSRGLYRKQPPVSST